MARGRKTKIIYNTSVIRNLNEDLEKLKTQGDEKEIRILQKIIHSKKASIKQKANPRMPNSIFYDVFLPKTF